MSEETTLTRPDHEETQGGEEAREEAVAEADNGGRAKQPRSKPSREEMQARGRKGGLASGRSRRGETPSGDKADNSDAAIVAKLRNKAARGDIAAARELREWQHLDPESDAAGDEWLSLLTTQERGLVRDLLRHVRARKLGQVEGEWLPPMATPMVSGEATGGRPSALPGQATQEGAQPEGEDAAPRS